MWKKTRVNTDLVDSKIVTRDFIIGEGSGSGLYGF